MRIASLMLAVFLFSGSVSHFASASVPSGTDWFEIHANPFTGLDDTGDGGTGNPSDLNYFYVGQSFDSIISIQSGGATAANIWIDYNPLLLNVLAPSVGAYFDSWRNQVVENGRLKSTGYNASSNPSSGLGNFGLFKVQLIKPTASNYGTASPAILDINTGQIAQTTESNIANNGADLLDSAEDFKFHVWADTKKPYADNSVPANGAVAVPVDSLFSFNLIDSLAGEGNPSGVGTGIDINSPSADITFNNGQSTFSLKANTSYTCSGIWGTNLCTIVVDRPPVTTYPGDLRKWNYGTTYTVQVSGYQDLASSNQNQLGDANGPNTMVPKFFTFTTKPDTTLPRLYNVSPAPDAIDQMLDVNLSFDVVDRRIYPTGISGSGMKAGTCRIDVSSPSFSLKTYSSNDTEEVTATLIDYGRRLTINPAQNFSSNETVTVRIYDCADLAGNKIQENTYTFKTVILDSDGDGILDAADNCPNTPAGESVDVNGCSDTQKDSDSDGVNDASDQCPNTPAGESVDVNGCSDTQKDSDSDGITDDIDNCVFIANVDQEDWDEDGIGDSCDEDIDGDAVLNDVDNCPLNPNAEQEDLDDDLIGDICDDDLDGDTILNSDDNCIFTSNTDQEDDDQDGVGDVCDSVTSIIFDLHAKPEKRLLTENSANLNLIGDLKFYNLNIRDVYWQDSINLDGNGFLSYQTNKLVIGNYDVSLKGESHLTRIIRSVKIGTETTAIDLDYTFAGTKELTAGDLYNDNRINSFDISTMLLSYRSPNSGFSDLNKDGYVNAPDIALIILNYFKQGESF